MPKIRHDLLVYHLVESLKKAKKKEDKFAILTNLPRVNSTMNSIFTYLVKLTYHPDLEWLLPDGKPPYTKNETEFPMYLEGYLRKNTFSYFVKGGGYEKLDQYKREKLFLDMLSSLDPQDAEIVVSVKNGTMPGLTKLQAYEFYGEKLFGNSIVKK